MVYIAINPALRCVMHIVIIHWRIQPPNIEIIAKVGILQPEARGPRGAKSLLRQISRSEGGVFYDSSQLEAV